MFQHSFDKRRLIALDLEASLTPTRPKERQKLEQAVAKQRKTLILVYISGRTLAEQVQAIQRYDLLPPDYIVSNLGTEIHRLPGENPLETWYRQVQLGFQREELAALLASYLPKLERQPLEQQTPLKLSYYWPNASGTAVEQLQHFLLENQLPANVYYSHNIYLDILPTQAGLGTAVKFLTDELVLAPHQVYVVGTGNQHLDLFQYGYRGIVTADASPDFQEKVQLRAYISPHSYGRGLLDGLHHYDFFDKESRPARKGLTHEAFDRAVSSLRRNLTPMGFSAASLQDNPLTDDDSNYFAVWSRDGIKTGLWSLELHDPDITECFRRTLLLMAEHQSEHGQIPANVQIANSQPDYGGIGGIASIDSVLWFVIGCCRYAAHTGDRAFIEQLFPHLKLAMQWLRAHDSNNCGLLEIPESSDWMDLFPRSYNVLYDEVLWYQACDDYRIVCAALGATKEQAHYDALTPKIKERLIRIFWPSSKRIEGEVSFAETQYTIGNAQYLLSQISPFGFSWRCDVYANLLASLVGLVDDQQREQIFHFLWGVGANAPFPVKCLYPPIQSGASDWKDYIVTNLLNLPEHYHNGGIWPFIGGLWVRFLAQTGRTELAHQELRALAECCRLGVYEKWEFNEWLHGQTGRPMGKAHQAWSAASYIGAYLALHHDTVSAEFPPLTAANSKPPLFHCPPLKQKWGTAMANSFLLVSDVDDTLLGDTAALEHFHAAHQQALPHLLLAYNSSRPCASLRESLAAIPALPTPDYLVGALGTEVEVGLSGEPLVGYDDYLDEGWVRGEITAVLAPFSFTPHPAIYQRPYKISYDIPNEAAYTAAQAALAAAGWAGRVRTIFSMGKNLDIIPAKAGKGGIIPFLMAQSGVEETAVVVAGDSANDRDLFQTAVPYKGIIVGNATPALRQLTGSHIYHARASHAAGVLEGLRYWGVPI